MTGPTSDTAADALAPERDEEEIEGGPMLDGSPAVAARGLLIGIALLMAGNGLQGSLLGVRTESEGFSLTATGVVMACYFAGFLVGSRGAEQLLPQVGHIRVFAALASTASAAILVHSVLISPLSWGLMRFVTGMCMAGLYVVAESWLNDMATNATRGRLLSAYMIASMGGLTAGQFLLEAADPDGFELFVLSSILVSTSLLPVTLSASSSPPAGIPEPLGFTALLRQTPTGVVSSFWVGTSAGIVLGLGAVYAIAAGVDDSRIPVFLAAPLVGSVVFQFPIGWVSDRVSRRLVMWAVAAAAALVSVSLVALPVGSWAAIALMVVLGGTMFPLYSLTIAYTADWLPVSQLTAASASLVRVNGVGAVFGPLVVAPLMSVAGPVMFFWAMAATHGVLVVYIAWRVVFRDALPVDRQRPFVAFPARASAVAAMLVGRRRGTRPGSGAEPAGS